MALSPLESHLLNDTRLRDRMLATGELTDKDVAKLVSALPDLAGEADEIQVYEEPTEEIHSTFEPA